MSYLFRAILFDRFQEGTEPPRVFLRTASYLDNWRIRVSQWKRQKTKALHVFRRTSYIGKLCYVPQLGSIACRSKPNDPPSSEAETWNS